MLQQSDFADAYGRLAVAKQNLYDETEAYLTASQAVAWARFAALAAGEIAGKNEAEREANARLKFRPLFYDMERAERGMNAARLACELAELRVQELARELRLIEINASAGFVYNLTTATA